MSELVVLSTENVNSKEQWQSMDHNHKVHGLPLEELEPSTF